MVKVMATGTFDLLHPGHIYYLKEARKLGDTLAVVVATDTTVRRLKHEPINPEEIRLRLIKELKVVDEAYLGHEDDMYEIVKEINPDVIALGFDQIHDENKIKSELKKRKINAKVMNSKKKWRK
jgi:FAD synthetase